MSEVAMVEENGRDFKTFLVRPDGRTELLSSDSKVATVSRWRNAVLDKYRDKCSGCGSDMNIAVHMIVPEVAGGKYEVDNGVVLCRTCEMARAAVEQGKDRKNKRRPANVWISRRLYARMQTSLHGSKGFRSMGSLVRFMMDSLVADPSRFQDLKNYQDSGSDVKINIWVNIAAYDKFKEIVSNNGLTVTDAIKGLILMYETEVVPTFIGDYK